MNKSDKNLPDIPRLILQIFLYSRYKEGHWGDLIEEYNTIVDNNGKLKAYFWIWIFAVRSVPGGAYYNILRSSIMFNNYLKIAIRNMRRNKVYSFINISGLAIGMAVFLLIMMFVRNEYSYDKFNEKIDRIYRVGFENLRQTSQAPAVGKEIKENIPEVQKMVRFKTRTDYLARYYPDDEPDNTKYTTIKRFSWVDEDVFDIFSFEFIAGDPAEALIAPFSIVLTESIADILFNDENPVGKSLEINNVHDYTVTGVIKDQEKFHLDFNALASFVTLGKIIGEHELNSYNSWNLQTYVLLPENHDKAKVAQKMTEHFVPIFSQFNNDEFAYDLYSLESLYFLGLGGARSGNLQFVYIFIAAAINI